jgi:hypothetical protein
VRAAGCWIAVLALLSFGGRAALAVGAALLAGLAASDLVRRLRAGLSYRGLTGGSALLVLMLVVLAASVSLGGIGERILGKIAWDDSAQVREQSLAVLHHMTTEQILFGVRPADIPVLAKRVGIEFPKEAIENFWVGLAMQVGAPLVVLFGFGLAAFLARLGRIGGRAVALGLAGFMVVASTSNSLSAKSSVLVAVAAMAQLAAAGHCRRRLAREADAVCGSRRVDGRGDIGLAAAGRPADAPG